jgi:hypothetical protein
MGGMVTGLGARERQMCATGTVVSQDYRCRRKHNIKGFEPTLIMTVMIPRDVRNSSAHGTYDNCVQIYCYCCEGAAKGPIVRPPVDTWVNMGQRWNNTERENRRAQGNTCLGATLSTTNPTLTALGANPGHSGEKPAANRLSYGTAMCKFIAGNLEGTTPFGI